MSQTNTRVLNLIDGTFGADDARDVLLSILNYKINYHQMKNFGVELRTGKEERQTSARIEQLKQTREQVIAALDEASSKGYKLKIKSELSIELINEQ